MSLPRNLASTLLAIAASVPSADHALPLLSEVFYDADGSDDGLSFVELYAAPGALLDGLTIEGVNGSGDGTSVTDFDLFANLDFQNGRTTRSDSTDSSYIRRPWAGWVRAQAWCVSRRATRRATHNAIRRSRHSPMCHRASTGR
jgi:hypothetical protein